MRHGVGHDIRNRPLGHDGPTIISALRAKIDDVVGAEDQVKIVFDHDHRVSPVKQLVDALEQGFDIGQMETCCRLVKNEHPIGP